MHSLNVMIVGTQNTVLIDEIQNSKYLNKLYITSDEEIDGCIAVKFNTFRELAQICKALQVDIVLVNDERWVLEGITNVMKRFMINCFAITPDWTDLGLSHDYARKMLMEYDINVPPIINLPVEFPVLVKGNGILKKANSIQDIIDIRQNIANTRPEISKTVFLEKYLNGTKRTIVSLYDGKHLLTFPEDGIDNNNLYDYSKKLETLLNNEKANFVGFFNSEIIEEDGILYNTGFRFGFKKPQTEEDLLYICLSATYQKLNEIKFYNSP